MTVYSTIISALDILHYGISSFILFGWMIGGPKMLIFHLFGTISILAHWMINGGRCMISEICGHGDNEFTKGLLKITNMDVDLSEGVMYIFLFILASITYIRLYFIYNGNRNLS